MLGTLYSFRRCPYAMRARLALATCLPEASLALREVVLKDKPISMLDISPKGTVPVLLLENEAVIEESIDIMLWAFQQAPEVKANYYPAERQLEMDNLISVNDGDFKWALDRYKYSDRFEESERFYREKGEKFLTDLETRLQTQPFLMGRELTLADLAIFPFVRQFAHVDKKWFEASPYTKLNAWLTARLESDLFKSIMSKYAKWTPESETVLFPRVITE